MSITYFIVLDSEDPGFDPFVNGKAIAKAAPKINKLAKSIGLKTIDDYLVNNFEEYVGTLTSDPKWFEASEGRIWVERLKSEIAIKPNLLSKEISEELDEYLSVFRQAESKNLKWHLEFDL